jgi:rare lipoprotein A (peptidoglycan hydrolase)
MKAKTKRQIKKHIHRFSRRKLVSKATSRRFFKSAGILLATISMGSLAYAITLNKPTVTLSITNSSTGGRILVAPPTPTPEKQRTQAGRASWYALGLAAPDAITCASRTFPRGSYLEVTNDYNNKVVICRVNDYGPEAWTGRVIDLSRGSFSQVEDLGRGTMPVHIRLVDKATGINLPIVANIAQIVGYDRCKSKHSATYCDNHRQDVDSL